MTCQRVWGVEFTICFSFCNYGGEPNSCLGYNYQFEHFLLHWHFYFVLQETKLLKLKKILEQDLNKTVTLNRLYGLNFRTSATTYSEKNEWLRTSVAVNLCFGSTTSIREIWRKRRDTSVWVAHVREPKSFETFDEVSLKNDYCFNINQVKKSNHQIFDRVRAVLPFWGGEVVLPGQNHSQHQHLFPVPEGRRACQQRVHDHPRTPSAAGENQAVKSSQVLDVQCGYF